jgi:hypothetical protein
VAVDYSITYGGLTIGAGTVWQIMKATGLEELPDVRTGDTARGYAHGEVPGLDLLAGRTVTVDITVFDSGAGDFAANVERLKAMTVPATTESSFLYQLPGRAQRALNCRPRRRSLPVDLEYSFRKGNAMIEFHATDPRIYDASFTSISAGLPSATTGLTFAATAPFVFGSALSGGSIGVANNGNFPAPWVATIYGPVVTPVLTLLGSGQQLTFNGTVSAGDTLVVDSLGRSVLYNGTASRYSWIGAGSVWFDLPVGNSTVTFGAASGSGTCTFAYRSCWI